MVALQGCVKFLSPFSECHSDILKTKHTQSIHETHCSEIQKRYQNPHPPPVIILPMLHTLTMCVEYQGIQM